MSTPDRIPTRLTISPLERGVASTWAADKACHWCIEPRREASGDVTLKIRCGGTVDLYVARGLEGLHVFRMPGYQHVGHFRDMETVLSAVALDCAYHAPAHHQPRCAAAERPGDLRGFGQGIRALGRLVGG